MLLAKKKAILNEGDGIGTFLLDRFGLPSWNMRFRSGRFGPGPRPLNSDYSGIRTQRSVFVCVPRLLVRRGFSAPSSAPAGATSPSAAGSDAPDDSGRQIQLRLPLPRVEAA